MQTNARLPSEGLAAPPAERLDSWKEIAAFLGRGVRTVQRWEREEGLPVHRLAHEKRGSVFAYREELSSWWESRRRTLGPTPEDRDQALPPTPSRSRRAAPVVLALFAVLVTTLAIAVRPGRDESAGVVKPQIERVTTTSWSTFYPALSPDGRMVAYASDGGHDGKPLQIWVQSIPGTAIQLTDCPRTCTEPSFSADGARIAYTRSEQTGSDVYEVAAVGGGSRLLRRGARAARWSPDGKWLSFISVDASEQPRLMLADGTSVRSPAPSLLGINFAVWSPDGARLLVRARERSDAPADWWTVTVDGTVLNTGILRRLNDRGFAGRWHTEMPPAWVDDDTLVFSDGTTLWQQRLAPGTMRPRAEPVELTRGASMAWFATAARGRVAFVSSNSDANLRSIAVDPESGASYGPLRRITRGSGMVQYPSLSKDGRMLAYSSRLSGNGDVLLRYLDSGSERAIAATPAREAYSAISPAGRHVAYGTVMGGDLTVRPITVFDLAKGEERKLCDDCRGRPREWIDERWLIIERPDPPPMSLVLLDTLSGGERPLVEDRGRSVANPRVSASGEWIAFEARLRTSAPDVFIAKIPQSASIPQSEWILVARDAGQPFWSPRGDLLYYLATRDEVRAQRIHTKSGTLEGHPFVAYRSPELQFPTWLAGTSPVARSNELIFVLGDFRGDVWVFDLASTDRR